MKQLRFKNDCGNDFPEPEEMTLGDIAERIRRKASSDSTAPVMMISSGNGFIYQSDRYSRDNAGTSLKNYTLLKKGELAYNHGYSKIRNFGSCFVLNAENEARVPYVYHTFRLPEDNPYYFGEYLNCGLYDGVLKGLVSSSVRMDGLLNISYDDYMSLNIMRPSKEEQDKVAAFLSLYDKKIEIQMEKVEALENRRKGLLQQIFSQEIRFKADDGSEFPDWESVIMEETFDSISDKNHPDKTVLTIIQGQGTIPRDESDRKISYNKSSIPTYKLVQENDFIMHLRSFEGGLEIATQEGIVSPAYTIMRSKVDIVPEFYRYYFRSSSFIVEKLTGITEGIRDGRSINMDDFWLLEIPYPSIPEQRQIGRFMDLINKQIQVEKDKLEAIKQIKKGLLQQMFV